MWNKAKKLLGQFLNLLLAVILVLACISYVVINSILATEVINDLRLDTYVGLETGLGIVMLVLLLGWGPVWLMRSFR
jgi:purine-cytosine permease-like protein